MLPGEESYWLARFLFQRGLAVIYLVAFLVAVDQFRPLAGEDGLLPLEEYVERASLRERPSLFRFVPDDRAIGIAAWTGVGGALLAVAGVPYWLPSPYAAGPSVHRGGVRRRRRRRAPARVGDEERPGAVPHHLSGRNHGIEHRRRDRRRARAGGAVRGAVRDHGAGGSARGRSSRS